MEARPNLRVIVCSGYAIDGPAQDILDAGAQNFIQKPFTFETLSEKLKSVFEKKQSANCDLIPETLFPFNYVTKWVGSIFKMQDRPKPKAKVSIPAN